MKASNKNFEFHRTEPANEVAFGKLGYGDIFQRGTPVNGEVFIKVHHIGGAGALNLLTGEFADIHIHTIIILYDMDATFTSAKLD